MPLSVTLAEKEGIQTVELKGNLILGEEERVFRDRMEELLLGQGTTRIVVNLDGVTEIDDTGMESLLCAFEVCRNGGGRLVLSNFHPAVIEPLTLAKLKGSIEVFGSEQEGINSFFPQRCVPPVDISRYVRHIHREKEGSS